MEEVKEANKENNPPTRKVLVLEQQQSEMKEQTESMKAIIAALSTNLSNQ